MTNKRTRRCLLWDITKETSPDEDRPAPDHLIEDQPNTYRSNTDLLLDPSNEDISITYPQIAESTITDAQMAESFGNSSFGDSSFGDSTFGGSSFTDSSVACSTIAGSSVECSTIADSSAACSTMTDPFFVDYQYTSSSGPNSQATAMIDSTFRRSPLTDDFKIHHPITVAPTTIRYPPTRPIDYNGKLKLHWTCSF